MRLNLNKAIGKIIFNYLIYLSTATFFAHQNAEILDLMKLTTVTKDYYSNSDSIINGSLKIEEYTITGKPIRLSIL